MASFSLLLLDRSPNILSQFIYFFYCLACFTATLIVYRVIFLSKILSSVVKFNFKAKSVMSMGMFHETFVFFR